MAAEIAQIFWKLFHVLQVNGVEVNPSLSPTFAGGRLSISHSRWGYVRASTDFGVYIEYNGYNVGYVVIPDNMVNMTEGLCGNHDEMQENDLISKTGIDMRFKVDGISHFVNSWQVSDPEDSRSVIILEEWVQVFVVKNSWF